MELGQQQHLLYGVVMRMRWLQLVHICSELLLGQTLSLTFILRFLLAYKELCFVTVFLKHTFWGTLSSASYSPSPPLCPSTANVLFSTLRSHVTFLPLCPHP